ncbi:DUF3489 domain-containing protein [Sphingomonas mucosissima]|uniref:DUF3489 domain-containing protein n=1 Tax=Sphingomonas mucosissima TaxID=370959 RepID=A0A245ZE14_9SPHN|nr:DUF3489 domain-containing protein [Sphingomonas mucosissima]OWK27995.1 hypothetical protein SPMU_32400 [Sphingomonas mucosissima]
MTLTDTQRILLSQAAQRDSGSLHPLPATITAPPGGIARSMSSLVKRGLVEERGTTTPESVWRIDGVARFGMFITATGKGAIGIEQVVPPISANAAAGAAAPRQTKAALVLALLGRGEGATLTELVEATGWLPHTTRAALTGLRRNGRALDKGKRDGVTCYRIVDAA